MTAAQSLTRSPTQIIIVRVLARRFLAERRRLIMSASGGSLLLAVVTTALFSSLGAEYDTLFDEMPPALARMLGDVDMSTLEGWLHAEIFSIMGPGLVIGPAIAVAAGALAGAEQDGRLTLITATPVRRSAIVAAAAVATSATAVAVASSLFLGILTGAFLAGIPIAVGNIIAATFMLLLLGITSGLIALAAGAASGRRGTAIVVAVAAVIASYCVFSFFPLSDLLEPFAAVSLWHPYAAGQPLTQGIRLPHCLVFAGAIGGSLVAAARTFERRDLRT